MVVEAIILLFGLILAFSLARFLGQVETVGSPVLHPNIAYSFPSLGIQTQNFIYGITLAMTSFIGIESIAQAAGETRRPDKWVPRAHKLSIVSVIVFAIGLSIVSMGMMSWQTLAAERNDPISAIAAHIPIIGLYLAPVVAVTGFAICYVSTNTGVIGVSRIVFSMGKYDLLPRWFYKVHPRFRTPIRTILVFGALGTALALVGELTFVADLYNYGALLSYVLVNVCLIVLRNKEPTAYRAWRIPGTLTIKWKSRAYYVPLVSVIGSIACSILWGLILTFHEGGRILGTAWVIIGVCCFILFRRSKKLPVTGSSSGKQILPGGYMMNAVVLVRTPEDEKAIVSSIKGAFDPRFRITLLNVLDPVDLGLSTDKLSDYSQIKTYQDKSFQDLQGIAKRLRAAGYQSVPRVEIGSFTNIIEEAASDDRNDMVVLITKSSKGAHRKSERRFSIDSVI